ncbi:MBL fold metallo-hydrolase [Limnoglobus roseus]|uniref:MBL fold metallo-hydrolase n=1 Tax=Limnoglobus roseus TaxID=2598579 RepID=A0A5C1ALY7_9BACT|nr:MBL fold metallo-hydrolase [Limnoglobus roseus]QEL20231.1 MBL fold metallo-hydrolase [Limnoglobus roseus]
MKIHHLNCGTLHAPPNPKAACHCLLLEGAGGLALVDTGIGLEDVRNPPARIGQPTIDAAGFQFHEAETAVRQIEKLGFRPADVRHILLTHADPDHAGGLADFPGAEVHLSEEELTAVTGGSVRYRPPQFTHGPHWRTHPRATRRWFGLEARPVNLPFASDVFHVPLFGHTLGHCGVAVRQGDQCSLHVGDAYYLRAELETDDHPVSRLAALRADDNAQRMANLDHLRRLARDHAGEISLFGYHDFTEFPH